MVVSIQPPQPNPVVRAAAEAALLKPGQVLEAVVVGRTPEGLTALKFGDVVIAAQLPQALPPGTILQLQVKVAGPAPQLVLVGTPQVPAAPGPAPVLPLPQVPVLPAVVSNAPAVTPVVAVAPPPVSNAPGVAPVVPVTIEAPVVVAAASPVGVSQPVPAVSTPQAAATVPQGAPVAKIVESRQTVVASGARIESAAVSPAAPAPTAPGAPVPPTGPAQTLAVAVPSTAAPIAVSAPTAPLQPASGPPAPVPAVVPSSPAPLPPVTAAVAAPQVAAPAAGAAPPVPLGSVVTPTIVPTPVQPLSPPVTATLAPTVATAAVPAAPVPAEPVAPSPLLVAQAATRPAPSATDMPKPLVVAAAVAQPQAPVAPTTPAAALAQMIPEALARQNSMAPLLVSLAAAVLKPGMPEPVVRAALQVLGQRVQVATGGPTAEQLETAVAKSGLYLEAALAKGAAPAGDLKGGLTALRGALATWLGGSPAPVTPTQQAAPPLRGLPPRAEAINVPPLPGAPHDAGRVLHGQADAALSRVKLLQLASLPDADPARAAAQELRLELPLLIGHELVMTQFQVFRDAARRRADGKRGWTMRFAMNFSATGEVGAEIGLLGRSVNVALWAADPDTAADLEAALPELAPALAALGLEPGAVRVRPLPPEVLRPASGQYVDSRR